MGDPSFHFQPPTPPRVDVEVGAATDIGKVRKDNEDHYIVVRRRRSRQVLVTNLAPGSLVEGDEDAYLMAVADGMGGSAFGELASQLALRTGWDLGGAELKWTTKATESELRELEEKAHLYFAMIDASIAVRVAGQAGTEVTGTTLTTFYSVSSSGFVFHAGDSRAYLLRGSQLTRLTRDHTVAQQLADTGVIPQEAVARSPYRHMLTNYVGGASGNLHADVSHVALVDGDIVLLCTDGLTGMVGEPEIAKTLAASADPQAACRALVDLALAAGGRDNVTAVVARYRIPAATE
jgi:PPM family protein phosphatase